MEVFMVVVILAIIAGAAIPSYQGTVEQSRSNEAITNLSIIHMGERVFFLNNGNRYWPNPDGTSAIDNTSALDNAVNTGLNIELRPRFYNISITSVGATYTATATRNAVQGTGGSRCYRITEAGGDPPLIPCPD